jgi:glycosyltransferase involved in cell wall biosynthesis
MNMPRAFYSASDLAFIIPTKDRPLKLKNLLESLATQIVSCGRLIIIDGGRSVRNLVMGFADRLPVEYYECHPPGQLRQKIFGISLLNDITPLVGFLDDDIVLELDALETMIEFWNRCEINTARVSFNIANTPPERRSLLEIILGLSSSEPGRVLRSGLATSNYPALKDLRTQWLCGGATVWRREILQKHSHQEISSRWAIAEDLIFSYPIGKIYPLYICAGAQVRHEHAMDYVSKRKHRYHGRVQTLWIYYFVTHNEGLSAVLFFWTTLVRIIGKIFSGLLMRQADKLEFAFGQCEGAWDIMKSILGGRNMASTIASVDSSLS